MTLRSFFRFRFRLAAPLALLLPLCAALAAPKVRGTLSTSTASVGEAVEYELIIEGSEAPVLTGIAAKRADALDCSIGIIIACWVCSRIFAPVAVLLFAP